MIELMVSDIKIVIQLYSICPSVQETKGMTEHISKKLEDIFLIASNWTLVIELQCL